MSQPPQNLDQDDSYLVLVLEKTRTKLLDKTRRNRLINYKESARDIAIIDEMPDQVYTQLVLNGKAFYFDSYEPPEEVTDSPEQGIEPLIDRTLPESQDTDLGVAARHRDDRLQTPFPKQDLERRLRKLYLDHRTIIEETGANNLYLALGFLQWCETGDDPLPQRSPLIFIPVRLERSRGMGAAVYTLTFDDEALDTNYSLHEKLKHNFEITLPLLKEEQLPEDYWTEVSRAIAPKQRDGWMIVRETAVGLFRFHKQVMWHDLDPKRWPAHAPITDKPLIKRILVGPKEGEPVPGPRTQEHYPDESDETNPVPQLPLIRDADSSQYTALVDALALDGLVIEGPPGTGKSQTISNLIAIALDQGLSVLFVAEKMAALEVVYKRLEEVGLGDFCMQLHGLKTRKKELLESVQARINRRIPSSSPSDVVQQKNKLDEARTQLIELSKALSAPAGPEDLPLFQLLWRAEVLRQRLPDDFQPVEIYQPAQMTSSAYRRAGNLLSDLSREWGNIPGEARAAWKGFLPQNYTESNEALLSASLSIVEVLVIELIDWLRAAGADDQAPCLFETSRALAVAALDPQNPLPAFPAEADLALAHVVLHEGLIESLKDLLGEFHRYLGLAARVNEVFDYAARDATTKAEQIKRHVNRLAGVACTTDVTIGSLQAEKELVGRIIADLRELPEMATPILRLTGTFARTLNDFSSLRGQAEELRSGPKELSLHGNPSLAKPAAKAYFDAAKQEFLTLANQATSLAEFFFLDRLPETGSIEDAHRVVAQCKNQKLPIIRKEYRRARKLIRSFLREPKYYSRASEFLLRIQELIHFCRSSEQFANNEDYRVALGSLFLGMDTGWQALQSLLHFCMELRESIGIENAQEILGDWDAHTEAMDRSADRLTRALNGIKSYARSHPFPDALWQRPVTEIATTLLPWSEKLSAAAADLSPSWCSGDASLSRALAAVDGFFRAQRMEGQLERHPAFPKLLEPNWSGSTTNIEPLKALNEWIAACLGQHGINASVLCWLVPTRDILHTELLVKLVEKSVVVRTGIEDQIKTLEYLGVVAADDWFGGAGGALNDFLQKLRACQATFASVPLMQRWHVLHQEVCDLGLETLADDVIEDRLVGEDCKAAFEYSVCYEILHTKIAANPTLAAFTHTRYEALRERFAKLDREMLQHNAKQISTRLCQIPVPEGIGYGPVKNYSEKRLLVHEANKQRRHIPIRQLVRRAGNALQALKPCFLMSPLSVAQYLPPAEIEFDLVVMDEASQLRPEDALGAIARGRRTIVVGDPKQLPPTTFFDTAIATDEDAEETIIDDTESILDVCLKQLPFRRLRWHYRSQHESLIRFSNEFFYEGDLVVFPSPKGDSREYGVHSTFIDRPSYRQGRNRSEAEVVVENIVHHFYRDPKKSLGVVALNRRQAEEIQFLLDKKRSLDPALDDLMFCREGEEQLFVKNLENVQGDERDVIFISITYGPEEAGARVYQRFGPINSELGWRRLNVVATRARQRVEVFTSMRPTDIQVGDGVRRGVRALRDYLEYAETGRVSEHGMATGGEPESDFEAAVGKILSDLGYEYDFQVGVTGFFIDIGVRHPDRPGEFLIGVECDGASYHSARSARDRDRLRQEILESKGWYIHRIWSTSWFHTRAAETERLNRTLATQLEKDRRISAPLVEYDTKPEVLTDTQHAPESELAREEEDAATALREALERFWEKNIRPQYPYREKSILSAEMIERLIATMPETQEHWFNAIPIGLRQQMEPRERQFLDDILDAIAEYA